jgi:hypothetical protein
MKMDLLGLDTQRVKTFKVRRFDLNLQVLDRPARVFA